MRTSTAVITLSSLLSLAVAGPIAKRVTTGPHFAVTSFTFSKNDTTSQYTLNVSFPSDVSISNVPADQPIAVVPGFRDAVTCTGTYLFTGQEQNHEAATTVLSTCGSPSNARKSVTTNMNVVTGELFLNYTMDGSSTDGHQKFYIYSGSKEGLNPTEFNQPQTFDVPALSGPGIDQ